MSGRGVTRRAAYEAACALAAAGHRPTIAAVRARLGGGGQRALLDGLDDWHDEVVRRFALPEVPPPLRALTTELWGAACAAADIRWAEHRAGLEAQVGELQSALAELRAAREAVSAEARGLAERLAAREGELHDTRDALERAHGEIAAGRDALRETTEALGAARAAGEEEARARALAERETALARAALQDAQARIARLEVDREVAAARVQLLEQSLSEAKAEGERGRAALAAAQSQAAGLARALAERDAQSGALAGALAREQAGREEDTRHWLARLEEQRAALAEAKERALTLALERRELAQEGRRLRAQLRECTERIETSASPSDSETQ
jgi:DNA repair exonuclease SbcCD ATPase subunit